MPTNVNGRSLGVARNGVFTSANTDAIVGGRLWPEAAATWSLMRAAFIADGGDPDHFRPGGPASSARSFSQQQHFWTHQPPPAAHPGTCLEEGTTILTRRGLRPIEHIEVGDQVWTHRGRWRHVIGVRSFLSPTLRLTITGHAGLRATAHHRWFTFDGWTQPKGIAHAGRSLVVRSSDDLQDALMVHAETFGRLAAPQDCPAMPSAAFARFCGHYVADGSFHDRSGPGDEGIVYPRSDKADLVLANAATADVAMTEWAPQNDGVRRLRFRADLARFMAREFGGKSVERTLPAWLLGAPLEQREAFLDGYLAGDGHWAAMPGKTPHFAYSTSSRALAYGVVMLARSLGMHACVTDRLWPPDCMVKGRVCRATHEVFHVVVYPERPATRLRMWRHEGFVVSRVRSVNPADTTLVYDLTVEDDESFIADGLVSHNSNHGWGIAVDIPFADAQAWIMRNGRAYGWTNDEGSRVGERWHMGYIGAPKALLRKLKRDPLAGYTASEKRWIKEYDELRRADRDIDRRRVLCRVMTQQRKKIWRAAQDSRGWTTTRRRRYASLKARTT